MSETMNNRTVEAEVSFLSDEAWEHLGGISTLRAKFGAVTKSTSDKSILLHETNFAFACAGPYSVP
jgi:hypothetical protein